MKAEKVGSTIPQQAMALPLERCFKIISDKLRRVNMSEGAPCLSASST